MDKDIYNCLQETLLKIRAAEEQIVKVYASEKEMRTPTHLSIGQEAVAAGLTAACREDDQWFAGHRCHAAFLGKGGSYEAFFAELCGRAAGSNGGRAGSAHLTDPDKKIFSSPILGAMIPVAVGAALSFRMDGLDKIAVAIFGDATVEEGVFAESVNFAVTKKLPVLFLCENNLYSTHSPLSVRQPASPIFERVRQPEFPTQQIDGNDAAAVYETLFQVIAEIRSGSGPQFVECLTYRIREHVGPLHDYDKGYRSKDEVDMWLAKCPLERFRQYGIEHGLTKEELWSEETHRWTRTADEAYQEALRQPWPDPKHLLQHV